FASKDDLLRRSLERLRDLLLAALGRAERAPFEWDPSWSPSRVLFEHVAEFADVRFALGTGRGGALLREAVDDVLAGVLRATMPSSMSDVPRELAGGLSRGEPAERLLRSACQAACASAQLHQDLRAAGRGHHRAGRSQRAR